MNLKFTALMAAAALSSMAMAENATLADGEYFIRNVSTGRYLTGGYTWGTLAVLKDQPRAFQVTSNSDGGYVIKSSLGHLKPEGELYMDGSDETIATLVTDGDYVNILLGDKYLQTGEHIDYTTDWLAEKVSCEKDMETVVLAGEEEKESTKAQWEFVTREALKAGLAEATPEKMLEASFFIKAHNIDINDKDNEEVWKYTKNGQETKIILPPGGWGHPMNEWMNNATYAWCENDNTEADCEDIVWQEAEGLPEGGYRLTYRVVNQTNTPLDIDINGVKAEPTAWDESDLWYATAAETLASEEKTVDFNVESDGKLTIKMTKSSKAGEQNRFAFKSFRLSYAKDKFEVSIPETVNRVSIDNSATVDIYDIYGVKIASGIEKSQIGTIAGHGIYVITDGKRSEKVML